MSNALVLIANAGDGTLAAFRLSADADDAALELLATSPVGGKCSTFAVDAERDLVYAGVSADDGHAILTLTLDRDTGTLSPAGRTEVPASMTYLALAPGGRVLLGASYGAGAGYTWPIRDGALGGVAGELSYANLHCVVPSGDGAHAYFVSLGDDLIAQYALGEAGALTPLPAPTVAAPPGSGPRHLVLNAQQTSAYVITEFSGETIRYDRDPATGELTAREKVPAHDTGRGLRHSQYGADPVAEHLIWGADVHLTPDGRWAIASERTESTLATVALGKGGVLGETVAIAATEQQPRGFGVSPDGRHVVAVGEKSPDAALSRIEDDGHLTLLQRAPTGNGPNWVRMLPLV